MSISFQVKVLTGDWHITNPQPHWPKMGQQHFVNVLKVQGMTRNKISTISHSLQTDQPGFALLQGLDLQQVIKAYSL